MRSRRAISVLTTTALALGLSGSLQSPALADGPGVGSPWIVSVGDSYISGDAGRWAGNSNNGESYTDALGPTAYFDNAGHTAETINRCHRSQAAEVYTGVVNGMNLACSGAKTSTYTDSNGYFKPGLDFASGGQAALLQSFAATHNVKAVAVSIGGNNFNFGGIVQSCVSDFLASPTWAKDYCNDDSSVTANFTSANITAQTTAIKNGLLNLRTAMRNAGYADGSWSLIVQNYMSPLPNGSGIRYQESGYSRQSTGGCGFWNADANWANSSALPTINNAVTNAANQAGIAGTKLLNLASAFNGRRLCESTVGLIEEKGLAGWWSTGAVDQTEWINQIRTVSTCCGSNYYIQESLHPNYWGQGALANCLTLAWNNGAVRGGTCTRGANGLNSRGEPNMLLS
ncbi:MAG: hypothetical protein QOJ48_1788 [Frankiales bacterium]|nr:hypothetical protein [Frankiales bacterium]